MNKKDKIKLFLFIKNAEKIRNRIPKEQLALYDKNLEIAKAEYEKIKQEVLIITIEQFKEVYNFSDEAIQYLRLNNYYTIDVYKKNLVWGHLEKLTYRLDFYNDLCILQP